MKRTYEEANELKNKADNYLNRIWCTQDKEFHFISSGVLFNSNEKIQGEPKNIEDNYQIKGIRLETKDGKRLHKSLEQIIEHFKKEDEVNIKTQSEPDK